MEKCKVIIGIPTIDSSSYIYNSLMNIKKEIELLKIENDVELIICINGDYNNEKIKKEINRFNDNICILETPVKGKNNALNHLIKKAKLLKGDIIHFLDDDVILSEGSLNKNIETLLKYSEKYKTNEVLVGSNAIRIQETFFSKIKEYGLKGIYRYFLYQIFSLPFRKVNENPKFCIGSSLGGFLSFYPEYPDDSTGIADDGYIGNYYLINSSLYNKEVFPLIKLKDSIFYFKVSDSYFGLMSI